MIEVQYIRDNPQEVSEKSAQKGYNVNIEKFLQVDDLRRQSLQTVEVLRQKRNVNSENMKKADGKPSQEAIEEGKNIKVQLAEQEDYLNNLNIEWNNLLKSIPNLPLKDVPIGASEEENVVDKKVGEISQFDFEPRTHAQIAEQKKWLDKERAAKVTGSRFTYVKGDLVKMQFALIQFIMDHLSDTNFIDEIIKETGLPVSNKPFEPILPPYLIRTDLYDSMDRLEPREDRYKIDGEDLWLQGSAEHVLGSMHANEILEEKELPIRYIGYATSFRREAGTYGKDMEGMFRMHQFDKLEMESLGLSEDGLNEHLFLIAVQEKIMNLLGIPYQVLLKCTADIGKPNARGVDIEAWLPGQSKYRETHTADYMSDYQARRLKTRVRRENGLLELVHTNDATALPLSRGPIAIIENYQTADGDVKVPEILQPYLAGKSKI